MSATAEGVIRSEESGKLVLNPAGTKYEVQLEAASPLGAGKRVKGMVTAKARKIWTIPAGGSFVTPLIGPPRVIQGRVKSVEGNTMVVQAGFPVCVELPSDRTCFDLKNGQLQPGVMVNVTVLPGAKFEVAQ